MEAFLEFGGEMLLMNRTYFNTTEILVCAAAAKGTAFRNYNVTLRRCNMSKLIEICDEDIMNLESARKKLLQISEPYVDLEIFTINNIIEQYNNKVV